MIDRVAEKSQQQGFPKSRLPQFTNEEIEYIKGTYDYFGLNSYTTYVYGALPSFPINLPPNYFIDAAVYMYQDKNWDSSAASSWLKAVPWGIRALLNWVHENYGQPEIIITENGTSDNGTLDDTFRIDYHRVSIQ